VELTLALHKVFNSPKDKFIFDVGHQSYTHKILTGRMKDFSTLRKLNGLCGFQKMSESEHDPWEAGHSSTSISAAVGMAAARDILKEDYEVISVIGDAALAGGMALEALNDLGAQKRKVIIIFNDNNMSISKNGGGFETAITKARSSQFYRRTKKELNESLSYSPFGKELLNILHNSNTFIKKQVIDDNLFTQMGLDYLGPVDGHSLKELIPVLEKAKDVNGPVVVHVITQKGKGYAPAENDFIGKWHGVSPFNLETGRTLAEASDEISWSEVISKTLMDLAQKDKTITVITPAMASGSKLLNFASHFPDRFFDCGIAEEHALTMAAGMAKGGLKPFVSIYSSFLQRGYDQISHDIARMNLPVVVGVDRAGLVGDDGETHQGIYDIAFLRTIPNVIICQPKNAREAQNLLYTGFKTGKPYFIRYPRGSVAYEKVREYEEIPVGSWEKTVIGKPEQAVIAYGNDVERIIEKAKANGMNLMVVNARFFKPVDREMIREIFSMNIPVTIYETDTTSGGLSDAVLHELNEIEPAADVIGIDDKFVRHGSVKALRKLEGISTEDLFSRLEEKVHEA
ncbi:MAG: 1-deoxy-D-xylulose-5-phosphate synthase, partial [Erysipelotrichaceae bacterium]|nr:1-deoxy-D-xylulose-5-phosphate synthase [Erysipelotrichaceae bacterium]